MRNRLLALAVAAIATLSLRPAWAVTGGPTQSQIRVFKTEKDWRKPKALSFLDRADLKIKNHAYKFVSDGDAFGRGGVPLIFGGLCSVIAHIVAHQAPSVLTYAIEAALIASAVGGASKQLVRLLDDVMPFPMLEREHKNITDAATHFWSEAEKAAVAGDPNKVDQATAAYQILVRKPEKLPLINREGLLYEALERKYEEYVDAGIKGSMGSLAAAIRTREYIEDKLNFPVDPDYANKQDTYQKSLPPGALNLDLKLSKNKWRDLRSSVGHKLKKVDHE